MEGGRKGGRGGTRRVSCPHLTYILYAPKVHLLTSVRAGDERPEALAVHAPSTVITVKARLCSLASTQLTLSTRLMHPLRALLLHTPDSASTTHSSPLNNLLTQPTAHAQFLLGTLALTRLSISAHLHHSAFKSLLHLGSALPITPYPLCPLCT